MEKKKQIRHNHIQNGSSIVNTVRTGMDTESLKAAVIEILFYQQGRNKDNASLNDVYLAVSYAVTPAAQVI